MASRRTRPRRREGKVRRLLRALFAGAYLNAYGRPQDAPEPPRRRR